ncbi:MAG: tetratricopeptide repeat protein, partial [Alphaproteobacteria bacterium]|nr:tetratricopeptide repeat protein [Alphaproteobacteria bacterium]
MTRNTCLKFVKAALLGSVALSGIGLGVVMASSNDDGVSQSEARDAAIQAQHAYAKHDYKHAIKYGERAVAGDPRNADYRLALGQSELAAGRFASAQQLFSDVLALDPARGRAALDLALTQAALGNPSAGRATLEANRLQLTAQDFGLAAALTGDTAEAIRVLEMAARSDSATPKIRQNLALAYALAGRWSEARMTASQDLSPELVDQRMTEWAALAHPQSSWEQVASVLHVKPANDPGLPMRLALQTDHHQALAQLAPGLEAAPAPVAAAAAPAPVLAATPTSAPATEPARYEVPGPLTVTSPAPSSASAESAQPQVA